MSKKKFDILPMKDGFNKMKLKIDDIFDIPFKLLIVGKSELSGKGTICGNLLLRDKYYKNHFDPENIYIVSQSANIDNKWKITIEQLDIPPSNIMTSFNEEKVEVIYQHIKDIYDEALLNDSKPPYSLIIFDDVTYDGSLKGKNHGVINKLFMNGRHLLISTIVCSQKYTDIPFGARENTTGLILFECSDKQLDTISEEHSTLQKKEFKKMFRKTTGEPHSFMVINYTNPKNKRYLNMDFEPIVN